MTGQGTLLTWHLGPRRDIYIPSQSLARGECKSMSRKRADQLHSHYQTLLMTCDPKTIISDTFTPFLQRESISLPTRPLVTLAL